MPPETAQQPCPTKALATYATVAIVRKERNHHIGHQQLSDARLIHASRAALAASSKRCDRSREAIEFASRTNVFARPPGSLRYLCRRIISRRCRGRIPV